MLLWISLYLSILIKILKTQMIAQNASIRSNIGSFDLKLMPAF